MTVAVGHTSIQLGRPYLTTAAYKQAPSSVDVTNLVAAGSQAIEDVELSNVIARSSSWIDQICHQVLAATVDTESMRVRPNRQGVLNIHPRYWPVIAVTQILVGTSPQTLAAIDLSTIWIESQQIVVPSGWNSTNTSVGPLQFNSYRGMGEMYVQPTYINGWAVTVLGGSVAAAATTIPVVERTGFMPGQAFVISDGESTEQFVVAASFTPASGAGNVTVTTGARFAHTVADQAIAVSGLPAVIEQACINMTSGLILSRGNASLVMDTLTQPARIQTNDVAAQGVFDVATSMLADFKRLR